jgi:hypothetical protein
MNVREIGCKDRIGLIWLKTGQLMGSCEHNSEPTGLAEDLVAPQEGLCCVELVM